MNERPEEIRIRLKRGAWEIEITCSEDKIQQAIESLLAGFRSAPPEPRPGRGEATSRKILRGLWTEDWFSLERSLAEVHVELARRGYHYDKSAVSHSLTDLVRENLLSRIGAIGAYRYVQKKPPEKTAA